MVKLLYSSPLWLMSNGIRMSHDNHNLSDTKIGYICNDCFEQTAISYLNCTISTVLFVIFC